MGLVYAFSLPERFENGTETPRHTMSSENQSSIAPEASRPAVLLLHGFSLEEADQYFGPRPQLGPPLGPRLAQLKAWPTQSAQAAFLERFRALATG